MFVQSFPEPRIKRQVSSGGGLMPRWSRDGRELFYVTPDGTMMVVPVRLNRSMIEFDRPRPLFQTGVLGADAIQHGLAGDGRFLIRQPIAGPSVMVTLNWFEQMKRLDTAK